jgi:hypothetical protein
LGSASNVDPPTLNFWFRWLEPKESECLLGVPVEPCFNSKSAWDLMISKMAKSIKHWTSQNLSVFGRIHAARSYVGSKSWYLATMIPLERKCLRRLTSMLWGFLQTNNNPDISSVSNRYYSSWPKQLLVQPSLEGGLNAHDYELQLTATLA